MGSCVTCRSYQESSNIVLQAEVKKVSMKLKLFNKSKSEDSIQKRPILQHLILHNIKMKKLREHM